MAATRSSRSDADRSDNPFSKEQPVTAWTGWIAFASAMMVLLGTFEGIQGFVAIFDDGYYRVTESGLVVSVDFTVWGWIHLALGILVVLSGIGIMAGNLAARTAGVVLAGLSAITNLLFIEAYPIWSVIVITVDVLVIYALTVHGRELKNTSF